MFLNIYKIIKFSFFRWLQNRSYFAISIENCQNTVAG